MGSPTGNSDQAWRVEGHVIKSGLNDLVMDASGSRVTMTSASDDLSQKWEFVPEDMWEDYEQMLESRNPLSDAAFWKKVAEYFINAIIGCDMDEYQSKVPDAISAINNSSRQLDEISAQTGKARAMGGAAGAVGSVAFIGGMILAPFTAGVSSFLSVGSLVTGMAGVTTTVSSGIARQRWDQQNIQAVKDVVGPLFSATMCLQGFLSRYVEKLKAVSEYLETEEGREIASNAYSSITSIPHVKQAQQIKDIIEYVQSDYYIFSRARLGLAVTAAAPEIPNVDSIFVPTVMRILAPLALVGVWDTVGGIKDIYEQSKLAEGFQKTAETLKRQSDNLIELWNEFFKRAELTAEIEGSEETI